jgi:hypothetical protein
MGPTASSSFSHGELTRIIDLDVDIGSDAVDYKWVVPSHFDSIICSAFSKGTSFSHTRLSARSAIANQESLSILEVEMLKLEGVVKEISDEMDYLKRREERMRDTNGRSFMLSRQFLESADDHLIDLDLGIP